MNLEAILFDFCTYVKEFHEHLIVKYNLTDIPYNVKGRAFPKAGIENINNIEVKYKFHGRGCTLDWNGIEIGFNVDTTSINSLMLSCYSFGKFIQTYPKTKSSEFSHYSYDELHTVLEFLEKKGVLMTRKKLDLGAFHINEKWYEAYQLGKPFEGENKNDADWV